MDRIQSLNQLDAFREKAKKGADQDNVIIAVGMATCGVAAGAKSVMEILQEELKQKQCKNVEVRSTGCLGFCYAEPLVEIRTPGKKPIRYASVDADLAREIVSEHIVSGKIVEKALLGRGEGQEVDLSNAPKEEQHSYIPFFELQTRIALRNCGVIDPDKIEDYITNDGYKALSMALSMKPTEVIDIVKKSGLRGRGGAGFPTGSKWEFCHNTQSDKKYVICNADEGDPGAFMDRSILEGDPHSVLEAMAICGHAIGADEGIIYIRAEYPLAVNRLKKAIMQAEECGLLGDNILGTGFNFSITLSLGAGAFVCGEETSLMNSVEGGRGEPRMKPPFPAVKGLWQKPTNINNVETFANIPAIFTRGVEWFSGIGTEKSKGTKVFALAGKVNNVGLVEVPMGTKLGDIVFKIGGGIPNGKKFKSAQTGGPSGGCLPAELLDVKIDYESLTAAGSMMGSGGMIIMDEDDCMVDIAKFYFGFTVEESCGRCTPCRIGNRRILEILEKITSGKGKLEDMEELRSLGEIIKDSSICGLGQTAPNPVLSTMRYFENEYRAHIVDKTCPARKCSDLLDYKILADKCNGCTLCMRNCPVSCISGEVKKAHVIDIEKCIRCGACKDKCRFDAIVCE